MVSLDSRNPHLILDLGGSASFGRDSLNTVRLDGKDISHNHARVFYDPYAHEKGISLSHSPWIIEDNSSNGVFVNFVKVGKGKTVGLKHGDLVWFSKLALKTQPRTSAHAYVFQISSLIPSKTLRLPPSWKAVGSLKVDHDTKIEDDE